MLAVAGCFSSGPSATDDINRGNAKRDAGDLDGAVAVYNQVLEADPKNALAILNRAMAEVKRDLRDVAMADYNQAISLDGSNSLAFYRRAVLKDLQGDFDGAIADYTKALSLTPADGESADNIRFQLALTLSRLHRDLAPAGLVEAVAKEPPEGWSKNVGRFLIGEMTEEALLYAAAAGDEKTVPLRQCEAYFYAGMVRLLKGDSPGARDLFGKCVNTGIKSYAEYDLARAEMTRLP